MKKGTLISALFLFLAGSTFGQTTKARHTQLLTDIKAHSSFYDFGGLRTSECDTFGNLISCDDTFKVYVFDGALPIDSGFLSGHNYFLDKGKAEKYTALPGDTLKGCWIWFGDAAWSAAADRITVRVWDDDGAGGTPGTQLNSKNVNISAIKTNVDNGDLTTVYFNTPILNPGTFYIGFTMTYPGGVFDPTKYVALYNNNLSNACSADTGRNTGWEQWSDNSWHSYVESYGIGVTNPVFPIVCSPAASCTITINPTAASICKGKSVNLTASGATTYSWSPSTGLNSTTTASVIAKPSSTTTYTVTGDNGACSNTVTVTVNPKPQVSISQGTCINSTVLLTANTVPSTGVSYKWFFGNSPIGGATNSTYTATQSGTYKVQVKILASGCKKNSQTSVTINCREGQSSLDEFSADAYPNPFVNAIQVNVVSESSELATIQLMDYSGRIIKEFDKVNVGLPFEINEEISSGVYFIQVQQGDRKQMIKVVKN